MWLLIVSMTEVGDADVSVCALARLDFTVDVWISDVDGVEVTAVSELETVTAKESWLTDPVEISVESSDVACEVEAEAVSMLKDTLVVIDITTGDLVTNLEGLSVPGP